MQSLVDYYPSSFNGSLTGAWSVGGISCYQGFGSIWLACLSAPPPAPVSIIPALVQEFFTLVFYGPSVAGLRSFRGSLWKCRVQGSTDNMSVPMSTFTKRG